MHLFVIRKRQEFLNLSLSVTLERCDFVTIEGGVETLVSVLRIEALDDLGDGFAGFHLRSPSVTDLVITLALGGRGCVFIIDLFSHTPEAFFFLQAEGKGGFEGGERVAQVADRGRVHMRGG